MVAVIPEGIHLSLVDIWFQDESRVGQQGSQYRIWAKRGSRPRVVKQQQFLSQYIFGAVCPERKNAVGIVVPYANSETFLLHLQEISQQIPQGRHAVLVIDQAGWHKAKNLDLPENLSLLFLPPYSPELNPQEQVWQYLKTNYLCNRVFKNLNDILDACCDT